MRDIVASLYRHLWWVYWGSRWWDERDIVASLYRHFWLVYWGSGWWDEGHSGLTV